MAVKSEVGTRKCCVPLVAAVLAGIHLVQIPESCFWKREKLMVESLEVQLMVVARRRRAARR